jgi:hypothetical protein
MGASIESSTLGIHCEWNDSENQIECLLPITLPTSKVRVKRRGIEPVAPRQTKISIEDFIEWQISYKDRTGRDIELSEILSLAYKNNIISQNDIYSIIEKFKDAPTFAEMFYINRESSQNSSFYGFKVLYEKTPILRSDLQDGCYIEMTLKHKQKAVGYQVMVYIYIPVKNVIPNTLIGRTAKQKEKVLWIPRREHILELLKAFLLASKTHREDIKKICLRIVKNYP